jgi:hypothetical protein
VRRRCLLHKGTKVTASLVIRCPGLAVGVSAPQIVTLPLHWLSRGRPPRLFDLLCRAAGAEKELVLALQLFVRLDMPELGRERFELGSARRCGTIMQIGSPSSNRTGISLRVNFQFMLKLALVQSVSTMPSNAHTASFG